MQLSDTIITEENYPNSQLYDYGSENIGKSSIATPYAMRVQARLYMLGFDPNGIDGIYGNDTFDAVKNFQILCDLPCTGIVDNATKLELAIDAWG